jgi:predicted secreted protein
LESSSRPGRTFVTLSLSVGGLSLVVAVVAALIAAARSYAGASTAIFALLATGALSGTALVLAIIGLALGFEGPERKRAFVALGISFSAPVLLVLLLVWLLPAGAFRV